MSILPAWLREPRRARRTAQALWILWAVIVWNVVFDHVIVVAGRAYLVAASAVPVGGPYVPMDLWMRPAAMHAFWAASASSAAILVCGFIAIRKASGRRPV